MNAEATTTKEKEKKPVPPALTYRGRNTICRAQGEHQRKIYLFDDANKHTIVPESFADFYALLKCDDIVLKNDPLSKNVLGRPDPTNNINEAQREKNIRTSLELERTDRIARKKKFFEGKVREKMEEFGHDIAHGRSTKIPKDAQEQAKEYAEKETNLKFGPDGVPKIVLPKMKILPGIDSV